MVNQKAISAKIDVDILDELEKECSLGWMKRNRHINEAIRFYLYYKDSIRRIKLNNSQYHQRKMLEEFTRKWFPMVDL